MATPTPAAPVSLSNDVLSAAATYLEGEISRIDMLAQAAKAIRSIGSLAQAGDEAAARLKAAVDNHTAVTAKVAQLEKDGETIIAEAKAHAEEVKTEAAKLIAVAKAEAEKVKAEAVGAANDIIAKGHADMAHIKTALQGDIEKLKSDVQTHTSALQEVQTKASLASTALAAVEAEYQALKTKLGV